MDSKHERYQHTADHCLQMALNSPDDKNRVSWLDLAQAWVHMIPPDQINISISSHIVGGKKPPH